MQSLALDARAALYKHGVVVLGVGLVIGGPVHLSGWGVELGIMLDAALRHRYTGEPVSIRSSRVYPIQLSKSSQVMLIS